MWMIRSGRGSEHVEAFLEHGIVAISWSALGALSPATKKDELLRQYAVSYPQDREGRRMGAVLSDYEWQPKPNIEDLPHTRSLTWAHEVARDVLSTGTRNTLGAIQTLFKLSTDAAQDLTSHAQERGRVPAVVPAAPAAEPIAEDEEARSALVNESIEKADDFIEDAISELDWQQVQDLVAGILRAMGYRTSVSEPGPDRGVDIRASPGGLGLQEPRIFVEVKHRQAQMGSKEIRAFLGGRKPGDKCLYVSTGGFTKDAYYEAERAAVATTLITLPTLRRLLVDYYETLDTETRALVPLRRLYWPDARK